MRKYRDDMTEREKWQWHTDVYAWRRVRLGAAREEQTSPPDPKGVWFNADMVDAAERMLQQKVEGQAAARTKQRDDAMLAEAGQVKNTWARQHGYADFEDYRARHGLDDVDATCNIARSLIAAAVIKGKEAFAELGDRDPNALLKALGVSAKERIYTPDELRRARIALGIDQPEAPAEAAE